MSEKLPRILLDAGFSAAPSSSIVLSILQPAASSAGWPNDQEIYILIADVSNSTQPLQLTTKVWVNDTLAFDRGGGSPYFKPGFQGSGSTFSATNSYNSSVNDIHIVNIDAESLWDSEEVVTIRVFAESAGGYTLDETYSFTVRDYISPQVVSVVAISPTQVEVTFNEAMQMDAETYGALNPSYYTLEGVTPPYYLPESFTVAQVENYKVVLTYSQELSHGQTYKMLISQGESPTDYIRDTSGNDCVPAEVNFVSAHLLEPGRDFDLWSKIPVKLRRWDTSLSGGSAGDTERFIKCLQDILDLLYYDTDLLRYMYDVDRAPMDSINLLLEQFGNPFFLDLTDLQKRKLLRNLIYIYRQKGTEIGIINAIFFFMGIIVTITKPFSRTWRLGYDKLGFTTYLGPSDSAARFTFWVNCPISLTDAQRKTMDDIIKIMKVAHEHHIILEPTPPPPATWRLGYDKLGIGTRLGG